MTDREIIEYIGDQPVYAMEKPWPRVAAEAIPGLEDTGPDRVEHNDRLTNGTCRLEIRRFGGLPDKSHYVALIKKHYGDVNIMEIPIVGEDELRPGFQLVWRVPWTENTEEME